MVGIGSFSGLLASSFMGQDTAQDDVENSRIPLEARRHQLIHEIKQGFRRACHGEEPGPVVLAVSGGRDSIALLIASVVLREHDDFAILPRVVHVHHHLRPEADAEASHVLKVAADLEVPAEVRDLKLQRKTPEEARHQRYEALTAAAVDCRASLVATAHHAEDQLETIIAALGRGSGPAGLAGMSRNRELDSGVSLVRPMLGISRQDAGSLCDAANIAWCDDPGNTDVSTQRGRLRRDVLPVMEEMWPGVASRVAATADLQAIAATAMEGLVASVFGSDDRREWLRADLSSLPSPVVASGFRRALLALGNSGSDNLSHTSVFSAAEAVGDRREHRRVFEVGSNLIIVLDARHVRIDRKSGESSS